jgi:hypothetical protein
MSSSHRYESVLKCAVSLVGAMLGIFLISLSGFSQASQGNIQGTVFDQTGGVIPGVAVTVTWPAASRAL